MPLVEVRTFERHCFALFSCMLCEIALIFGIWLCFNICTSYSPFLNLQYRISVFYCCILRHNELIFCLKRFFSIHVRSCSNAANFRQFRTYRSILLLLFKLKLLEIYVCSFSHSSPTCFHRLNWNFVYDFFVHVRLSSNVVTFRQVLSELCPFSNLKYWKFTVFRTYLQNAQIYWLSGIYYYDFVFMYYLGSLSVVTLCQVLKTVCPFWTNNTENMPFSAFFIYMLWHIKLTFCIWLCSAVLHSKYDCIHFASSCEGVTPF